jgi:hypothetical protein
MRAITLSGSYLECSEFQLWAAGANQNSVATLTSNTAPTAINHCGRLPLV